MSTLSPWPVPLPPCVKVDRRGNIAVLRLDRPEKRNALSDKLVLGLQTFFSSIPSDVHGVVMHGSGDNFCAGLDLNELKEADTRESFETAQIGQRLNESVQYCKVPVIAVLHGAVIGGGLELAAAAHIRVAVCAALCPASELITAKPCNSALVSGPPPLPAPTAVTTLPSSQPLPW